MTADCKQREVPDGMLRSQGAVQTCYPYTASPVLLPIAGPDYINAVSLMLPE